MSTANFTPSHARDVVARIVQADDGAHALELLELINAVADPDNEAAREVERFLYMLTPDFESHFQGFLDRL